MTSEPGAERGNFSGPASSTNTQITVEHCAEAFAGIAEVEKEMRELGQVHSNPGIGKRLIAWADRLAVLIGPAS